MINAHHVLRVVKMGTWLEMTDITDSTDGINRLTVVIGPIKSTHQMTFAITTTSCIAVNCGLVV